MLPVQAVSVHDVPVAGAVVVLAHDVPAVVSVHGAPVAEAVHVVPAVVGLDVSVLALPDTGERSSPTSR